MPFRNSASANNSPKHRKNHHSSERLHEKLEYGIREQGVREVTVNEQNPQAVGFYEHMGFETYQRTACDEEGNPYPLLYMKLK